MNRHKNLQSIPIYLLGAQRELLDFESTKDRNYKTEADMMQLVYQELSNKYAVLSRTFHKVINTPMQKVDGMLVRASTMDTIYSFKKEVLIHENVNSKINILVISSQPYVRYQNAVVESVLNSKIKVTTIGNKAREDYDVAKVLDAVARFVYQEYQNLIQRQSLMQRQ